MEPADMIVQLQACTNHTFKVLRCMSTDSIIVQLFKTAALQSCNTYITANQTAQIHLSQHPRHANKQSTVY